MTKAAITTTLKSIKPTYVSLGYALFVAVNATVIWGGVFPFLPMSFQAREITVSFFLTQSIAFMFYFVLCTLCARFNTIRPVHRFLEHNSIGYALGWIALIAATYVNDHVLELTLLGGVLIGFNTAGFFVRWNVIFAADKERKSSVELLRGMAYAPLVYFALYLIPIAMTVYLVPLVFMPLFTLAMKQARKGHEKEIEHFEHFENEAARQNSYRQVIRDYWKAAVCIGSVGFASGVMRSIAVSTPANGELVNMASMVGVLISSLLLFALWSNRPMKINTVTLFRIIFPALMALIALMPLFGEAYLQYFAAITYAIYGCAIIIMMMQCEKAARVRGVTVAFVYGFTGAIIYAMHDFGFITGQFASELVFAGADVPIASAFVMAYVLAFAMYLAHNASAPTASGEPRADHVEFVSSSATPETRKRASAGNREGKQAEVQDRLSKQVALAAEHYELSKREAEILNMFVHGHSAKRVAEELLVSENTVNTHVKRMYRKLGVHKKQQLVDLVETFNPKAFSSKDD
ncbi:hypothetical protein AAY81_09270 [Denitrobacterium detoxificans]|uniref:helix-turn-helix transcriptional regulator n=1 Tax=Denitrobacterium detoxificans TaxID=79604 RepID=UPI0007C9A080|nr:helix-turn-helix transcriptional regulator [Denitrobacterium detoxificans]ANE23256.1 hypothetical protein AAY81_09270 [Denitrobacterium detoxificans]